MIGEGYFVISHREMADALERYFGGLGVGHRTGGQFHVVDISPQAYDSATGSKHWKIEYAEDPAIPYPKPREDR